MLPPPSPPLFLVSSPPPFTRSPSAPRIDAIVSTNGAASAIRQLDERVDPTRDPRGCPPAPETVPDSYLTSGGVSTPMTPPPRASSTGAPSIPGIDRTSAISSGGEPWLLLDPFVPHSADTCPPTTEHEKCDGASAANGDAHATNASPAFGTGASIHHPSLPLSPPDTPTGASKRTRPVTAAPRFFRDECGKTPPDDHPEWMAPSPSVLARASTASDASRGTVAARTLARIHPPGSSPGPGFSRPGRTCTSAPGTSGDDDGDPGRALSSRNGRNSASGAMNRVRSSVVVRGSSPGGLDAGLGSFSAVADIATTGAPSMEPEPSSSSFELEGLWSKKAASAAMSPRGSGPRTRTVAVSPMARLVTSDGPCIAPPIGTRALTPPRAPEHWRC